MSKKNDPGDLIGFKDFLDYQEDKIPTRMKRTQNLGFELYSFLERESIRLSKFLSLFEEKAFVIKNYPQDTKVIIDTESTIIETRVNLIAKLGSPSSQINSNISDVLKKHFKS
jgi:hypothetical protein